jgi:hypothetical protein
MAMLKKEPLVVFAGICTFTWYRPVNPGVKPEKDTVAGTAPNAAVACCGVVGSRLVEDAGLPVTIAPLTGPSPVA